MRHLINEYKLLEAEAILQKLTDVPKDEILLLQGEIYYRNRNIQGLKDISRLLEQRYNSLSPKVLFQHTIFLARIALLDLHYNDFKMYIQYGVHRYRQLDFTVREEVDEAYAELLTYQGLLSLRSDHLQLAEEYFSISTAINTRIGNHFENITNLRYLGVIARLQNRLVESADFFTKSLLLHNVVDDPVSMSYVLTELIMTSLQLSKPNDAKEVLSMFELIISESNNVDIHNLFSYSKALLMANSTRASNKIQALSQLETLIETNLLPYLSQIYSGIIELYLELFDTFPDPPADQLSKYLQEYYKHAQKTTSIVDLLQVLLLSAQFNVEIENYDKASKYLVQAEILAKEYEMESYLDQIDSINKSIHLEIYLQEVNKDSKSLESNKEKSTIKNSN